MDDCTDILNDILSELNIEPQETSSLPDGYKLSETAELPSSDLAKKLEKSYLGKLPLKISTGGRHDSFKRYAGLLHACGYSKEDIEKKLIRFDKERMEIPKNDIEELKSIINWVQQKPPAFIKELRSNHPNPTKQPLPI